MRERERKLEKVREIVTMDRAGPKARSKKLYQTSHVGAVAQALGLSSAALPIALAGIPSQEVA